MTDTAIDRLVTLKVKDVMSRDVVCVTPDQALPDVAQLFVDHRISGVPVTTADGSCIGVLSAVDYVKRERIIRSPEANDVEDTVAVHMSASVQSVRPEQTLLTAARIMCAQHVHRLPVLDMEGRAIGLVTSMDVVAALVNAIDEREAAAM
jgi:CBS-domain-containing membrane protein